MKGSSKVIMGATLVMVVSIAILLGLVLVLLAELYCSLLFRRRQKLRASNSTIPNSNVAASISGTSEQHDQEHSGTPSLSSFYAQGVLQAPRNLLFPALLHGDASVDLEKQHSRIPEFCESPADQQPTSKSRFIGRQNVFSLPSSPSFLPLAPAKLVYEVTHQCSTSTYDDEVCGGSDNKNYVYICNPIYDNDASKTNRLNTPFETPDSSPSRFEPNNGSSGEDNNDDLQFPNSSPSSESMTPPLTPMKKLPAEACSVTLRDARSLATSGSESNSNNEGISSTSSSGSPCTSPSW